MAIYIDGRVIVSGDTAGFVNVQNPRDLAVLLYNAFEQNDVYATLVAEHLATLVGPQAPLYGYGETGSRPTSPTNGEMFFDATLGLPVWYNSSNWVDAAGNIV